MKKGFTLIFADLSAEFRGFLASKNQRKSAFFNLRESA
jgi:hypothetical protein